jgi:DNA-binding response OmpR family regulator
MSAEKIFFASFEISQENSADVYDDGVLRVEHDNYFVVCNGENVRLPRTEFLVISRLARTPERWVAPADLWRQVWINRKPFNPVSLHVYIYRLRQKFEPYGVRIETMINVGYRLIPTRGAGAEK